MKRDGKSLYYEEWADWVRKKGEPSYRTEQLFRWIHQKKVSDFSQMSNIPAQFISTLQSEFYLNHIRIQKRLASSRNDTVKYLYMLADGERIETVFMRYHFGNSVCISSEVGCRMGCRFCASTQAGLIRPLTASEMLDQVELDQEEPVSHVVIMGIGEPLDNFEELVRFLRLISHPDGRKLSLRHITVSTCGLVEPIYRLADCKFPVTLAVSLHASNDLLRNQMMPVNRYAPMAQLFNACRYYIKQTRRRITFEYACIKGVNDSLSQAIELSQKLRDFSCHVNLIPMNPIEEQTYVSSSIQQIQDFAAVLKTAGIPVTVRRTLGQDINAACGQLRRREIEKEEMK